MQERKTRVKLAGRSSLCGKEGSGREGEMGWGGGGVGGTRPKRKKGTGGGTGVGSGVCGTDLWFTSTNNNQKTTPPLPSVSI